MKLTESETLKTSHKFFLYSSYFLLPSLHLCRRVRLPSTSVLVMTLNNLMVKFQYYWSFGECGVPFHCHLIHCVCVCVYVCVCVCVCVCVGVVSDFIFVFFSQCMSESASWDLFLCVYIYIYIYMYICFHLCACMIYVLFNFGLNLSIKFVSFIGSSV